MYMVEYCSVQEHSIAGKSIQDESTHDFTGKCRVLATSSMIRLELKN